MCVTLRALILTGPRLVVQITRTTQRGSRQSVYLKFRLDLTKAPWTFWNHVGEAHPKCRHLAKTPLPPELARKMERVYLA